MNANDKVKDRGDEVFSVADELGFKIVKHVTLIKRQARSVSNRCSKVKASDKKTNKTRITYYEALNSSLKSSQN